MVPLPKGFSPLTKISILHSRRALLDLVAPSLMPSSLRAHEEIYLTAMDGPPHPEIAPQLRLYFANYTPTFFISSQKIINHCASSRHKWKFV